MVLSQVLFAMALDYIVWRHVPNLLSAIGDIGIVISLGVVLYSTSQGSDIDSEVLRRSNHWRPSIESQDRSSVDLESIFSDDNEKRKL